MTRDSYSKHFPPTVPAEVAARAIELDDMPVGVALAVRGGFIFCATDRAFFPLPDPSVANAPAPPRR